MSIMDDVDTLRYMAQYRMPVTAIRQVQQDLLELNLELRVILGSNFGPHQEVRERSSVLDVRLESLFAAVQQFEDAILNAANALAQAGG